MGTCSVGKVYRGSKSVCETNYSLASQGIPPTEEGSDANTAPQAFHGDL